MNFSIGDTVDAYRILEELGRGGMGRVYKVEHTLTRRLEAMKVLKGGRPDAPGQGTRSLREIQVQARLDHPNIAAVHHAFWSGDDLILVMELIEGCSLQRVLEAGCVPLGTAIDYACQALAALECAHANGVIHRDVSPANMLISPEGVLKLTDFGLSKSAADPRFSQPGAPIGSLYYMSPEQVRGAAVVGEQSDIYSLGAVLYELVTGKKPFDGSSAFAIMVAQVEQQAVAPIELEPSLPAELNSAILRALAKDPAERFQSAQEFRQELLRFQHSGIPASKPFAVPHSWIAAACGVLAVASVGVAGFVHSHRTSQPAVIEPLVVKIPFPKPPSPFPGSTPTPAQLPKPNLKQISNSSPPSPPAPPRRPPALAASAATPMKEAAPPPPPAPAISNAITQPVPPTLSQPAEPPLPIQELEHPPATQAIEPLQPPSSKTGAETPNPGGLKKGLGKVWHFLRGRKSSSPDDTSAASSTQQP